MDMRFVIFMYFCFLTTSVNAMNFEYIPEFNAIYATGEIKAGDADKLLGISSERTATTLLINSEGGLVAAAIAVAEVIKHLGLKVHVPDMCASACAAVIFPAGKTSTLSDHGVLGFHECYSREGNSYRTHEPCNELTRKYAVSNGFPYGTLKILAHNKGPSEMMWITRTIATCYGWHSSWSGEKPFMNEEAQPCVEAVLLTRTEDLPYGPSFDCQEASNNIERLICSDPDLMMVDAIMGNLYWTVFAKLSSTQQKKLRSYQRAWIKNRNHTCEPKIKNVLEYSKTREAVHCMSVSIQKRMRDLSKIQKMQN